MPTSIFLAKLIGPILVLTGLGVLANRKSIEALAQEILGGRALLFLFGLLDFAAGLAIVLTHNVWVANWRVIITLIGWLLLVRGAVRVLIPDQVKPFGARMLKSKYAVCVAAGVTIALGIVLCCYGYLRYLR